MQLFLDRQHRQFVNDVVSNTPLVIDKWFQNDSVQVSLSVLDPPYPYTAFINADYYVVASLGTPGITGSVILTEAQLDLNVNTYDGTIVMTGYNIPTFLGSDLTKECYLEFELINSVTGTNSTIYQSQTNIVADLIK